MRPHLSLLVCLVILALVGEVVGKAKPRGYCGKKPKPHIFNKYTKAARNCKCWFDWTRFDCACCIGDPTKVQQCGFPMQRYCYKKLPNGWGCPGVCQNRYTLSTRGYPCYSNPDKKICAWCTPGSFQCEQNGWTGPHAKGGNRCMSGRNRKYCDSIQGDCRHIDKCDYNAECKLQKKINSYIYHWACKCKDGFTGNGIQCKDADGFFSLPPKTDVEVEIEVKSDLYTYPHTEGNYSYGNDLDSLFSAMSQNEVSCLTKECESEFNQANTSN